MEFKVLKLESGLVVVNFDDMKANLIEKLESYKGYLVTETNLPIAKSDRAILNKLAKAIEDKRKEVKKEIMKIYDTVFEPQCKELVGLIKTASDEIDAQVKALEERERQAKQEIIIELWNGLKFDLVNLERIFKDEWLNKGTSERKIQDDMQDTIATIRGNLALLDSTNEPDTLKAKYLATLNIEQTMAQYKAEQEAKARLQPKPIEPIKEVEVVEIVAPVKEKLQSVNVQIIASESQIIKLRKVLEMNGYTFKQLTDIIDYVG